MENCPKLHPDKVISDLKGDAFVAAVAENRPSLMEIHLNQCKAVSDEGLAKLIQKCSSLHPNKIASKCKGDKFLFAVAEFRKGLTEIDVSGCEAASDAGLAAIVAGCPDLAPDNIISTAKSNMFCQAVAKHRPNLESLDLGKFKGEWDPTVLGFERCNEKLISLDGKDNNHSASYTGSRSYGGVLGHAAVNGSGKHTFTFKVENMLKSIIIGVATSDTDLNAAPSSSKPTFVTCYENDGTRRTYAGGKNLTESKSIAKIEKGATVKFELDRLLQNKTSLKVYVNNALSNTIDSLEELGLPPNTALHPFVCAMSMRDKFSLRHKIYRLIGAGDESLASVVMGCPKLLPDNLLSPYKGDAFCAAVSKQHPALLSINLDGFLAITDAGLAMLMENCLQLHPNKVFSKAKGDKFLAAVAEHHNKVTEIDLSGCQESDDGLANLISKCQELHPNKVTSLNKGDAFLKAISEHRPALTEIDVTECNSITDAGLAILLEKCPQLLHENVSSNPIKGDAFLAAISARATEGQHMQIDLSQFEALTDPGRLLLLHPCFRMHPDKIKMEDGKKDSFLFAVVEHQPGIENIDLMGGYDDVTDGGLGALMEGCLQLHPDKVISNKKSARFLTAVASKHSHVTQIDLTGCIGVTDASLTKLMQCPKLHPDSVRTSAKGDSFLSAISKFRHETLTELDLSGCEAVTDAGLSKLMEGCVKLHPNAVKSNAKGNSFLTTVGDRQPHLKDIDLTECPSITDDGLAELMEKCLELHPDAVLSEAKGDAFLEAVAEYHPDITKIKLLGCKNVTDAGLAILLQNCKKMVHKSVLSDPVKGDAFLAAIAARATEGQHMQIDLSQFKALTDDGRELLLHSCFRMHPDNIDMADGKNDAFLNAVMEHQPGITEINLKGHDGVTDGGLTKLISKCSALHPDCLQSNLKGDKFLLALSKTRQEILTQIDLTGCETISDVGLSKLMKVCLKLHPDSVKSSAKGNSFLASVADKHADVTQIDLTGCPSVADAGLAELMEKCRDLHPDKVVCNAKGDAFLEAVSVYHAGIDTIDVLECESVTDAGLAILIGKCPDLHPDKVLSKVKGDGFVGAVPTHHADLMQIDLTDCDQVSDAGLANLMKECPNLMPDKLLSKAKGTAFLRVTAAERNQITAIDLTDCQFVTDEGLAILAEKCVQLHPDKITSIYKGDKFLKAVADFQTELEEIDLTDCKVTDKGLATLVAGCSKLLPDNIKSNKKGELFCSAVSKQHRELENIDLTGCDAVTDAGLAALVGPKLLPSNVVSNAKGDKFCSAMARQHHNVLTSIDLVGCEVTDAGLATLLDNCTNMPHENVFSDPVKGDAFLAAVAARGKKNERMKVDLSQFKELTDHGRLALLQPCFRMHPDQIKMTGKKNDEFLKAVVEHQPGIVEIDLRVSDVTDAGLEKLMTGCLQLHPDKVHCNKKGPKCLSAVANKHADITEIDLVWCDAVSDESLANVIEKCLHLHPDRVLSKRKGNAFLNAVAKSHTHITQIDLVGCSSVTDVGLAELMKKCPRLHPDKIQCGTVQGDLFVMAVAEHHQYITEIDLRGCETITDAALAKLIDNCPKLHPDKILSDAKGIACVTSIIANRTDLNQVTFTGCKAVSDSALGRLMGTCHKLHPDKVMADPKAKGDAFLTAVAQHQPGIEHIDLLGCNTVTDSRLAELIKSCPNLLPRNIKSNAKGDLFLGALVESRKDTTAYIDLTGCDNVTDQGLARLLEGCPNLSPDKIISNAKGDLFLTAVAKHRQDISHINLSGCEKVTDESLKKMMSSCLKLDPDEVVSMAKGDAFLAAVAEHHEFVVHVDLTGCETVTDDGLAVLVRKTINLHPNSILSNQKGDTFLGAVAQYRPDITEIDLSGCELVTDVGLCALFEKCTQLNAGTFVSPRIGDAFLSSVAAHHHETLTGIDLTLPDGPKDSTAGNQVTDASLGTLIRSCERLDPEQVISTAKGNCFLGGLAESHPRVKLVDLTGCKAVTDSGLATLMEKCPLLHPNNVFSESKGDAFLSAVPQHHANLKEIHLTGCDGVTDAGLAFLMTECHKRYPESNLMPENVMANPGVKGPLFLSAVAKSCPTLVYMDLVPFTGITDEGLAELLIHCKHLHPDSIVSEDKGDVFLSAVAKHRPELTRIDLSACAAVTDAGLAMLMEGCRALQPNNVRSDAKGAAFVRAVGKYHADVAALDLTNSKLQSVSEVMQINCVISVRLSLP